MPAIVTFDGPNKIITEISVGGDNELTVAEVYSEWKVWVTLGTNAGFLPAFSVVGGDPITPSLSLGSTFFLENGWRIRPAELSHKLTLVGNLFTREASQSAFVPTIGSFNVNTETRVSSLAQATAAELSISQLNDIAEAVRDVDISTTLPDSLGRAIAMVEAMTTKSRMFIDQFLYNSNGFAVSCRIRVFPTEASAALATAGGSGEGEIFTSVVTGSPDATYPSLPVFVRGVGV